MEPNAPIFKSVRFDALPADEFFWLVAPDPADPDYLSTQSRKISARTGKLRQLDAIPYAVKPSQYVTILDTRAMDARDREAAKPLFDGTRSSCKSEADFYALHHAMDAVVTATEKVDAMADYLADKMASIKYTIRRTATELTPTTRYDARFSIAPASIAEFSGLNSCGEVQGNGNIDMLIATLLAKREAFVALVSALGYRLS